MATVYRFPDGQIRGVDEINDLVKGLRELQEIFPHLFTPLVAVIWRNGSMSPDQLGCIKLFLGSSEFETVEAGDGEVALKDPSVLRSLVTQQGTIPHPALCVAIEEEHNNPLFT